MPEKKARILHLIKSLGRGGAEMLLPETVSLHDRSQYDFHCIYFLPWKDQLVPALEEVGVTVHCFNASNNIRIISKATAIARYCKENKIDLIHCHLPWAGFVGRLVHKLTGLPVIYTEHNKQERYNRITAQLNKRTFNWQQLAIAVSADVSASIQKNIHPNIPVRTILNGVNTSKFQRNHEAGVALRKNLGIKDDDIVIGNLAVFRFQKRLKEWMAVIKELITTHPNVRAILVGDGPLNDELLQERKAHGLEEYIIMPGLQTNTIEWFSAMDIFMMTSVFEGLPIALLEAMSCETAVLSTNAGGISEVISNGYDGMLCDVEEWPQLSSLAKPLILDKQYRSTLAKAGREKVIRSFSLQTMVGQLEDVYETYGNSTGIAVKAASQIL